MQFVFPIIFFLYTKYLASSSIINNKNLITSQKATYNISLYIPCNNHIPDYESLPDPIKEIIKNDDGEYVDKEELNYEIQFPE